MWLLPLSVTFRSNSTGSPAPNRNVSRESQQKVSYLDAMEILVIKGLSPAQFS
jgi:hypothetical protein